MVFLDPKTGLVYICDWKRSKRICDRAFGGRTGWGPCSDLPDCNLSHYRLQLNTYRFLFESQVGKKVGGMFLAVFHPNQENFQFISVPDYSKTIATCLGIRRLHLINSSIASLDMCVDEDRKVALQTCLVLDCLRCDKQLSSWCAVSNANNAQEMRKAWEKLVIPTVLVEDIPLTPVDSWLGIGYPRVEVRAVVYQNTTDGSRVFGL